MIMDLLDQIIGPLPYYYNNAQQTGYNQYYYQIVEYVIAGVVLLFMLSLMYRFFIAVFGRWLR